MEFPSVVSKTVRDLFSFLLFLWNVSAKVNTEIYALHETFETRHEAKIAESHFTPIDT